MNRLIENTVFCELVTACRLAACPIKRSPLFAKATIEGVVPAPSEFSMTTGSPPSITAIQELVVPRSIPRILAIGRATAIRTSRAKTGKDQTKMQPLNPERVMKYAKFLRHSLE